MKNIVLIGMMGCGKSTCGKILSKRLKRPLVDTDGEIVRRDGRTIPEIFAQSGEEYFRGLESEVARSLSQKSGLIIATGGGLPLRKENREALRENATVFFLYRTPEEIFASCDMSGRPLAGDKAEEFVLRYRQREPIYREMAHVVIADTKTPGQAVRKILRYLKGEKKV